MSEKIRAHLTKRPTELCKYLKNRFRNEEREAAGYKNRDKLRNILLERSHGSRMTKQDQG
ncbi:hypothetical protein F2Q70_00020394 [Brassica cretica]|uniref:Uncharacterized protein n=1 Tax=Brassica cretica TaxID=69181 RepID=A0A8S9GQT5_BRACR|nr:hypothetical protein F2Q70_00020394 [Brassica cretica]KAF2556463.1 hypothetical protein F2Q68_00013980 [Brassica cretica]